MLQRRPSITKLLENRLIQKYLQKSLDATMQKNEMPGRAGAENRAVGKKKPARKPVRQAKPMRPRAVNQPKVKARNALAATRRASEMDATRKVKYIVFRLLVARQLIKTFPCPIRLCKKSHSASRCARSLFHGNSPHVAENLPRQRKLHGRSARKKKRLRNVQKSKRSGRNGSKNAKTFSQMPAQKLPSKR